MKRAEKLEQTAEAVARDANPTIQDWEAQLAPLTWSSISGLKVCTRCTKHIIPDQEMQSRCAKCAEALKHITDYRRNEALKMTPTQISARMEELTRQIPSPILLGNTRVMCSKCNQIWNQGEAPTCERCAGIWAEVDRLKPFLTTPDDEYLDIDQELNQ